MLTEYEASLSDLGSPSQNLDYFRSFGGSTNCVKLALYHQRLSMGYEAAGTSYIRGSKGLKGAADEDQHRCHLYTFRHIIASRTVRIAPRNAYL